MAIATSTDKLTCNRCYLRSNGHHIQYTVLAIDRHKIVAIATSRYTRTVRLVKQRVRDQTVSVMIDLLELSHLIPSKLGRMLKRDFVAFTG